MLPPLFGLALPEIYSFLAHLGDNLVAAAKELEDYYYTLKSILDQFEKEKSQHWGDPV